MNMPSILQDSRRGAIRCCLGIAAILTVTPAHAQDVHLYKAGYIWPGSGPAFVNGGLLVRDGKVIAVGKLQAGKIKTSGPSVSEVLIPAGAQIHDLGSAVIIPGLVIGQTTLGERGRDDDRSLTPEFRAIDGFDFTATTVRPSLAASPRCRSHQAAIA